MLCEIQHIGRDRLIGGRPILIRAAALGSDRFFFLARGIVIADRLNPRLDCLFSLGIQEYRGIGQPVWNGFHMIMEQWQPMFDAGGPAPFADRIEHQIATGIAAKQHAIGLAEAVNMLPVQHDFADRAQNHLGRFPQCALIHGVEPPDRLQLIPKEIKAQRIGLSRWEDIDNPAPDRIFTGFAHRRCAAIAIALVKGLHRFNRKAGAWLCHQGGVPEGFCRWDLL